MSFVKRWTLLGRLLTLSCVWWLVEQREVETEVVVVENYQEPARDPDTVDTYEWFFGMSGQQGTTSTDPIYWRLYFSSETPEEK
jgi:hypothetical protein